MDQFTYITHKVKPGVFLTPHKHQTPAPSSSIEMAPPTSGKPASPKNSDMPADKPVTRSIGGKAIVIELSGSEDEDDAADEGAAQDTLAPEASTSKKRKLEKTSSASSSLPSSRSLSEFRYTPDWLKNRDNPAEREPTTEEVEEKEEAKKEKKERKAKKAKKDEEMLESQDYSSQIAGERPTRQPPPHTQDTGYTTSAALPQFEDPDPTPASFWQDKAPGVEEWLKDLE
ncbi:hypothetical protein BDV97DRAFT_366694 [Delphinella strobiligena]|nr:hypothetical protein BDV97DRAFT_366694 [Delphinella strobiligena]